MAKQKYYWMIGSAISLSIIAIMLSCAALFATHPRYPELDLDYQGWITGVLSLLVTVLLGWNIYSVIDLKGMRDEIRELKASMEKQIKHANDNTRLALSIDMIDSAPVLQAYSLNVLPDSVITMFEEFHKISNKDSVGKMMARNYIKQNLLATSDKGSQDLDKLVKVLSTHVSVDAIEDFYHDLRSRNDDENPQQHEKLKTLMWIVQSETWRVHQQQTPPEPHTQP